MYKKLLFTSVSAIVLINTQPSLAEETLIDLSDKPITTPTLDYLHEKDASYPESAYTITPGTEDDYSFIAPVADSDGNITNEYYKINFKNTDRITWPPDGDRTLTLNLPNAENPTEYKYTYTMPEGYTEVNTRINNTLATSDVQDVVFKDIIGSISGGAINNTATLPDVNINADFINNSVQTGSRQAQGGAIYNYGYQGKIGNITGDFIGNYAISESNPGLGGAIFNDEGAKLGKITGNFLGNYVQAGLYDAKGGAIYNAANTKIDNITGNFINNFAEAKNGNAVGGAIYNTNRGVIGDITGDFIGNHARSGGAIHNGAKLNNITGDFIGNYAEGPYSASGGAIFHENVNSAGMIGDITGNFIRNYAKAQSSYAQGGAINSTAPINSITGDFIENHAKSDTSYTQGGAIYVWGKTYIVGDFIRNFVLSTGNDSSAYAHGGAIYNKHTISSVSGNFTENYAKSKSSNAKGGAIYNDSYRTIDNIINSSFIGNYAEGNEESQGGAIYSTKDITITAQDSGKSEFTGNYVLANGVKSENAIYMDSDSSTLSLNALTNGQILFNDEIDGVEGYKIAINGDSSGVVTFNNHIRNADITLSNTNMIVDKAEYLGDNDNLLIQSGNLTINSGEMTIKQLGMNTLNFKSLSMPGGLLRVDSLTVDLANQTSGMITADTASGGAGKIKVESVLLTSDGQAGSTPVQFVSEDISKEVTTDVTEALAPIYKYGVEYNNESGEFVFTRGDLVEPEPEPDTPVDPDTPEDPDVPTVPVTPIRPITPAYKAFNPGVFANDVAAMSGLNMQGDVAKQVFDLDTNREYCFGRVWATPYYSDDTLGFSDFYDVDSKNYGLIAGVDTRAFGDYDGWNSVYTLFGAYNDGESKYQGVKVDSKSWLVGLKASVYNGGFYGDAIVNYAWHDSDQKTAFGTDSVDSTGYGAALKAGYKHGFDKVELDTSAMLSWQTIEGDDFTSKSGARISTDDYSRLTLTPQVKLGYSFEKVRPYALVRYNFVLDEDVSSTVNNIALPTIESKDYVEYGLGLETTDTFPHSGFAHVLRHDGGRDGWSVTAGYKYNF